MSLFDEKTDDDEYEFCSVCYEQSYKNSLGNCEICSEEVLCEQCKQPGDRLTFNEWLANCPNYCSNCKRVGCVNCISTCIQCWNISEKYPFLCKDCSNLVTDTCEYHNWTLCIKHKDRGCPECESNKNYGRYDIF